MSEAPDKLSKYSSFCVVDSENLFLKTTKEGWDLVQVMDVMVMEEKVSEIANPHPPPAGYQWPDRNVYSYEKPKGWNPTIEQRSWESMKVPRFLIGKNEEKLKIDITALQAELDQSKRDHETAKKQVGVMQVSIEKLTVEKNTYASQATGFSNQVNEFRVTEQRQGRELNLKEAQILRYEKELEEYKKLLPPPTAGLHERTVDVSPVKDPEIPF